MSQFQSKATVLPSGERAGRLGRRIGSRANAGETAAAKTAASKRRVTGADSGGKRARCRKDMARRQGCNVTAPAPCIAHRAAVESACPPVPRFGGGHEAVLVSVAD